MIKQVCLMIVFTLVFGLVVAISTPAQAERFSTTVRWNYDNPPPDLAGFILECWPDPTGASARTGVKPEGVESTLTRINKTEPPWEAVVDLDLDPSGSVCVMRAYDTAGNEAPNSDPYYINPAPPRVININITININGNGNVSVKVNKNNE